jgi:hypothetical protein
VNDTASVRRVERTLRRVAELRSLFLRLPHLASPQEQRWIDEFEAFVGGQRAECCFEALEAGFRDALRRHDAGSILRAVERSGDWILRDPALHPYYYWAKQASRDSGAAARTPEPPRE